MSSPSRSKNQSSSKTSQFSSKSQYSSKTSQSSSSPLAVEGEPEVVRVGVVGSGLSGLSLAYLLSIQPWIMKESQIPPSSKKFHVVLFEKSPKLGMDSASFALPCACWKCSGDTTAGVGDLTSPPHTTAMVDVPMRSFFPEYYPYVTLLYDHIQVPYTQSDNSMSFVTYPHLNQHMNNDNNSKNNSSDATADGNKKNNNNEGFNPFFTNIPASFPATNTSNTSTSSSTTTSSSSASVYKKEKSTKTPPKTSSATATPSSSSPYFSFSCYNIPWINTQISLPDPPVFPTTAPTTSTSSSSFSFLLAVYTYLLYIFILGQVVFDYFRLLILSKFLYNAGFLNHGSRIRTWKLGEFFEEFYFSNAFVMGCFFPLFSGVCTCSIDTVVDIPCCLVLEYVAKCMPFGKMSFVTSSINHVVTELSKPIHSVKMDTAVTCIQQIEEGDQDKGKNAGSKQMKYRIETNRGEEFIFDHLVFATQANQAVRILKESTSISVNSPTKSPTTGLMNSTSTSSPAKSTRSSSKNTSSDTITATDTTVTTNSNQGSPSSMYSPLMGNHIDEMIQVLSIFPYDKTMVICHKDESILPKRDHWRFLNFACESSIVPMHPSLFKSRQSLATLLPTTGKGVAEIEGSSLKKLDYISPSYGYNPHRTSQTTHLVHFKLPLGVDDDDDDKKFTSGGSSNRVEKTISAKITFDIPANKYTTDYVLQTTNPIVLPDPTKTFSSSWFERCVVNLNSFSAVHRVWGLDDASADAFFNKVVMSKDCRHHQVNLDGSSSSTAAYVNKKLYDSPNTTTTTTNNNNINSNIPAFLRSDSTGIQGKQNIWFIGSYIWPGIPLLEGCVASAVQVARGISFRHNVDLVLPWDCDDGREDVMIATTSSNKTKNNKKKNL